MHPRTAQVKAAIAFQFTPTQELLYGLIVDKTYKGWSTNYSSFYTELPPNDYGTTPGEQAGVFHVIGYNADGFPLWNNPPYRALDGLTPRPYNPLPPPIDTISVKTRVTAASNPKVVKSRDTIVSTVSVSPENAYTVLYWKYVGDGVDPSYFTNLGSLTGSVTLVNGQATISATLANTLPLRTEPVKLSVRFYADPGYTQILAGDAVSIITPEFALSSLPSTLDPGDTLTNSLIFSNVDPTTIVYWRYEDVQNPGTVIPSGYFASSQGSLTLQNLSWQSQVLPNIANDLSMVVRVYKEAGYVSLLAESEVQINRSPVPVPVFTGFSVSPLLLNEGQSFTSTVTGQNIAPGTPIYWELSGQDVLASYFNPAQLRGQEVFGTGQSVSWTTQVLENLPKDLLIRVSAYSSPTYATSTLIGIPQNVLAKDTTPPPTVSLALTGSPLSAGGALTASVTSQYVLSKTLYWTATGPNITDFLQQTSGTISLDAQGEATWQINAKSFLPSTITGNITVYLDAARTQKADQKSFAAIGTVTYLLQTTPPNLEPLGTVNNLVTTTNVPQGTTLYWSYDIATPAYIQGATQGSVIVDASGLTDWQSTIADGTIVTTSESLTVNLYDSATRTNLVATATVQVNPFPSPAFYALSTNKPSGVVEDDTFTVVVNATNNTFSTVYYKVTGPAAALATLTAPVTGPIALTDLKTGSVTLSISDQIDPSVSASGTFTINIYDAPSVSGTPLNDTPLTVQLRAPEFNIVINPDALLEGSTFNVQLATANVPNGNQYYYKLNFNDVSPADFLVGDPFGTLTVNNGQAVSSLRSIKASIPESITFTVTLYYDSNLTQVVPFVTDTATLQKKAPVYTLSILPTNGGQNNTTFTLTVTTSFNEVPAGTNLNWVYSGITSDYVTDGRLSGTVTLEPDGSTSWSSTLAKFLPLSPNPLTVKIYDTSGAQVGNTISGWPITQKNPAVTVTATPDPIDPGQTSVVELVATNIADGQTVYWEVSPLVSTDVVSAKTGTATISGGKATFNIQAAPAIANPDIVDISVYDQLNGRLIGDGRLFIHNGSLPPSGQFTLSSGTISKDQTVTASFSVNNYTKASIRWRIFNNPKLSTAYVAPLSGTADVVAGSGQWQFVGGTQIPDTITVLVGMYDLADTGYANPFATRSLTIQGTPVVTLDTFPTVADAGDTITNTVTVKNNPSLTSIYFEYTGVTSNYFQPGTDLFGIEPVVNGNVQWSAILVDPILTAATMTVSIYDSPSKTTLLAPATQVTINATPVQPTYQMSTSKLDVIESDTFNIIVNAANSPLTEVYYQITGAVNALLTNPTGPITLTGTPASSQGVKTIAIEPDIVPSEEGPLIVKIFDNPSFTGAPLTPSVTVYVSGPRFTTSINPNSLGEGAVFDIEVNALHVPSPVTAYWRLSASGGADINQFVDGVQGSVLLTSGTGTVAKAIKATVPGSTEMTVTIYEDSGYTQPVASNVASISKVDPTYILSSDKPSASDGQTVTFTLRTTNVPSITTLYWRVTGATTSVFAPGTQLNGSLTVDLNSAQWAMTFADTIPSNGTLVAQVYLDNAFTQPVGNPVNVAYATIKIPTYNFTTFPLSVTGGDTFTTSVTTTYVNAGTVLYAQYTDIPAADLVNGNLLPTVTIGADGKGTFSSTLKTPITASSTCTIKLYKDAARTIQAGTDVTTVAVSPNPVPPSYQLTTSKTSVIEASTFDINVLANNSPLTEVWYEITGAGTSTLVTPATGSIPLTSNSTQGVKTITIKSDLLPTEEGPLVINIFGDGTFTGSPLTTPVTVNVNAPRYTTVINPDALEEGSAFAIQVNALYVPSTVTVYWRLSASGSSDIGQFVDGVQGAVLLTSGVGSVSKAIKASIPGSTEMTVEIYEDSGYTRFVASDSASVSKVDPTYVLSSNKPSVTDGENVRFTLTTTNVASGQTLYWKVTGATTSDFTAGTQLNGNLTIVSNTAQWAMTFADPLPNNGTLVAQVYSDNAYTQPVGNPVSVPYATSKIPTYNFTTFPGSVTGGDTFTTSVTTQYVDAGTILYAQYSGISNTTLVGGDLFPTVTIGADGKGTFSSTLKSPITSSATCTIRLYKDAARLVRAGNDITSVTFVPNPVPVYQMTTTKSAVIESDTFDINVLANNSPLSTVYYEITGATDALVSPPTGPITLTANSTSGVQTIQIESDIIPAEEGTLFIKIFDNPAGTGTPLTPTVSVSVSGPVFTTVFNPTTLGEGSAFDIEVNALHVPSSVTAYWRLSASAPADINQFVDGIEGPITLTSGSGSVSKAVKADIPSSTEMTVKIYEDSGFTQFAASNVAPISKTDPTYVLSSNASSAVDGQTVTFSLATTNVSQGKQLFWRVTGATTSVFAAGTSLTGNVTVTNNFAQWAMTFADPIPNSGTLVAQAYLDNAYTQPVGNSVSVSYASAKVPTYTFTTTPASVTGGQTFTTFVTTKYVNAGTILYAEYTGVPAADIVGGNVTPTVTIGADGKGNFSSTLIDPITANATCTIKLYKDAARTIRAGTTATTVSITPNPIQPAYVIKSNDLDLFDGDNLRVDVTGVPDGVAYYKIDGPGATAFTTGPTGQVTITGGVGYWNSPVVDPITTNGEFTVGVYDNPSRTPPYLVSNTLTGKVTHLEPAEFSIITGSKILYNGFKFKVTVDAKNFGSGTLYYQYSSSTPGVVTSECFVSRSLKGQVTTDASGNGFWIGQLVQNCPSVGGNFNVTLYQDEDLQYPVGNILTLSIIPITVSVNLVPLPGTVNSGTTFAINGSTSVNLPSTNTFYWKWDVGAENLYAVASPLSGKINSNEWQLYRDQLTLRYPGYDLPPASRPNTISNTFGLYADSDHTQELANLALNVNRIPAVQFPDTNYIVNPFESLTWEAGLSSDDPKLAGKKLIIYVFGEGVADAPVTVSATALATETATQLNGQTALLSNFVIDQKHTLTFTYPAVTPNIPQGDIVFTLRIYDGTSGKLDLNAPFYGEALFNIRYNPVQPYNTFQVLPTVITGGLTTGSFASIEDVVRPQGSSIFWNLTADVPINTYFSTNLAGVTTLQNGAGGFQIVTSTTPPPDDIVVGITAYSDVGRTNVAYAPQFCVLTDNETSEIKVSGYMDNDAWRYVGGFNQAQAIDYWRPDGLTADTLRPVLADLDRFFFDANLKPIDTGVFYTPTTAESGNNRNIGQALVGNAWNPSSGDNYGNNASDTSADSVYRAKGAIYNALLQTPTSALNSMVLTFGGPRNAENFNTMDPEVAAVQMVQMANLTGAIGINLYYDSNDKPGYYQPLKLLTLVQALRAAAGFELELYLTIRASQDETDSDNRLACVIATKDVFDYINLITFTNRSTKGVQWNQQGQPVEEAGGVTDSMITLSRYLMAGVDRTQLQLVLACFGSNNSETTITNPEALSITSGRDKVKNLTASFHSIVTNAYNPPTLADMNVINRWRGQPDWMRAWGLTSTFQPGADSQGYFPGFGILQSPAVEWNFPTPLTITNSVDGAAALGIRGVVLWNLESDFYKSSEPALTVRNFALLNAAKEAANYTSPDYLYTIFFQSPIESQPRVINPGQTFNWKARAQTNVPLGTTLYWRYENINPQDFSTPVSGSLQLNQIGPNGYPEGGVSTTTVLGFFTQNTTPTIGIYSDAQYLNRVTPPFKFFMVGAEQSWTLTVSPEALAAGSSFNATIRTNNAPRQNLYFRYTGVAAPYVLGGTDGTFLFDGTGTWLGALNGQIPFSESTLTISVYTNPSRDAAFLVDSITANVRNDNLVFSIASSATTVDSGNPITGTVKQTGYNGSLDRYLVFSDPNGVLVSRTPIKVKLNPDFPVPFSLSTIGLKAGTVEVSLRDTPTSTTKLTSLTYTVTANPFTVTPTRSTYTRGSQAIFNISGFAGTSTLWWKLNVDPNYISGGDVSGSFAYTNPDQLKFLLSTNPSLPNQNMKLSIWTENPSSGQDPTLTSTVYLNFDEDGPTQGLTLSDDVAFPGATVTATLVDPQRLLGDTVYWGITTDGSVPADRQPVVFPIGGVVTFDFTNFGSLGEQLKVQVFGSASPSDTTPLYAPQYLTVANGNSALDLIGYIDVTDWRNTGGFNQALPQNGDYKNTNMIADQIRNKFSSMDKFGLITGGEIASDGRVAAPAPNTDLNQLMDWPDKSAYWNYNTGTDNGSDDGSPNYQPVQNTRLKGALFNLDYGVPDPNGKTVLTVSGNFNNLDNNTTAAVNFAQKVADVLNAPNIPKQETIGVTLLLERRLNTGGDINVEKMEAICLELRRKLGPGKNIALQMQVNVPSGGGANNFNFMDVAVACQAYVNRIELRTCDYRFSSNYGQPAILYSQDEEAPYSQSNVPGAILTALEFIKRGVNPSKIYIAAATFGLPSKFYDTFDPISPDNYSPYGELAQDILNDGDRNKVPGGLWVGSTYVLNPNPPTSSANYVIADPKGNQLWSFDSVQTLERKIVAANRLGLGGIFLYGIDKDYSIRTTIPDPNLPPRRNSTVDPNPGDMAYPFALLSAAREFIDNVNP